MAGKKTGERSKKPRISDEQFRDMLIKELAKPDTKANLRTNFYELLRPNYSIHKGRALELHARFYSEYVNSRTNKLVDASISKEKEALELSLNDKNEHSKKLLENIAKLEKQAAELEAVKVGVTEDGVISQIDVNGAKRALVSVYAEIRATRKLIGDWYGLNAPTSQKVELTDKSVSDFLLED